MIITNKSNIPVSFQGLSTDDKDGILDTLRLDNCGSEFYCVDTGDTFILNTGVGRMADTLVWYLQPYRKERI